MAVELSRKGFTPYAAKKGEEYMNAAQRKEVSERMSRYWAARRAEKASGGGAGAGKAKGRRRKTAKKAADAKKAAE